MSSGQTVEMQQVDQARQEIRGLVQEIAHFAKQDIPPQEFFREFLPRVVTSLAAVGGAVWTTSQDGLCLEFQVALAETGLVSDSDRRNRHGAMLQRMIARGEPALLAPLSGSDADAANPSDYLLITAPLKTDREVLGVVEIFQRPELGPVTQRGWLNFLVQMCDLAGGYLQGRQLRQYSDRQALWAQWNDFTRAIHASLDPREAAYSIANEARRLLSCDRVSVVLVRGRRCRMEAISGQEVFDSRAGAVRLLERLAAVVAATGEPLWYTGDARDLPPQIEAALEEYLDESHSKTLALLPLRQPVVEKSDERDKLKRPPPLLAMIVVEQFEDQTNRQALIEPATMVAEHGAVALANALAHHRLFLMPVWRALGSVTGGRTFSKALLAVAALLIGGIALVVVPADFELQGTGTLQPVIRRDVFAAVEGTFAAVPVQHGSKVKAGDTLAELDNVAIDNELIALIGQRSAVEERLQSINAMVFDEGLKPADRDRMHSQRAEAETERLSLGAQIEKLQSKQKMLTVTSPIDGEVVTWDVRNQLLGRSVTRGDLLMRVVDPGGQWELEVLMPEDRMGHIRRAQQELGKDLRVSFITATSPGETLEGRVLEIHDAAEVRGDEGNTVMVRVAIDKSLLDGPLPGAEVTANVYCGRRPLGYVWLHDAWAFLQSRVFFRFF